MKKGRAVAIIKDIHGETDPEDKLLAIQEITWMETINSVTKSDLLEALRWLIEEYI